MKIMTFKRIGAILIIFEIFIWISVLKSKVDLIISVRSVKESKKVKIQYLNELKNTAFKVKKNLIPYKKSLKFL